MKKTRFTEEQMVTIAREADTRPVPEVAKNTASAIKRSTPGGSDSGRWRQQT
jgi:hypothetical protein